MCAELDNVNPSGASEAPPEPFGGSVSVEDNGSEIFPEYYGVEYTEEDLQKEYDEIRDFYELNTFTMSLSMS